MWHPDYSFHPDEAFHLEWALDLFDGVPFPRAFMYGGTFHQSVLKISSIVGERLPDIFSPFPLYRALLVARLFSVFAAVLTVLVVFYIAKDLYGCRAGLIAAALLGVSPGHVFSSQQAKPDVIMAFFAATAVFFSLRIYFSGRILWYILAGIAVGMATGTKISGLAFLFPPVVAHFCRGWNLISFLRKGLLLIAFFMVGYLIVSPHSIVYPTGFMQGLEILYNYQSGLYEESIGRGPGWLHYATRILPYGIGIPVLLASLVGLIMMIVKRERCVYVLMAGFIAYYALISTGSWITIRYAVPLFPILCVFAARAFTFIDESRPNRAFYYAMLVITIAYTFFLSAAYNSMLSRKDTRIAASEWIEKEIRDGAAIGFGIDYEGDVFFNPPINSWKYRVISQILNDSNGLRSFISNPFDYIIINEYQYSEYERLGDRFPVENYKRFFDHVMKSGKYRMIKEFKNCPEIFGWSPKLDYPPSEMLIPSPTIKVYQRAG